MFRTMVNIKDVTRRIDRQYQDQIASAGPVMAALFIDAHIESLQAPPSPSVAGAHLTEMSFWTWADTAKYLRSLRPQGTRIMGAAVFDKWAQKIADVSASPPRLLSLTLPLLISSQMQVFGASPSQPQEVLIRLLSPIAGSPEAPLLDQQPADLRKKPTNASITVVLVAGKVPFVLTCHSSDTLSRWLALLEAATVLLLPQAVVQAESMLPEADRRFMLAAIAEMLSFWSTTRPKLGQVQHWRWQPSLM